MGAAYALLGLVVGIVMDEVIRRRVHTSRTQSDPRQRVVQRRKFAPRDSERERRPARSSCSFLAKDYYDR